MEDKRPDEADAAKAHNATLQQNMEKQQSFRGVDRGDGGTSGIGSIPSGVAGISSGNAVSLEALDPMMQFFGYQHLPPRLQGASKLFHDVAANIVLNMPRNPERTVALRKLLEAKDAGVRCIIYRAPPLDPKKE